VLDVTEFPQIATQVDGVDPRLARPALTPEISTDAPEPARREAAPTPRPEQPPSAQVVPMYGRHGQLTILDEAGEVRTIEQVERDLLRYAIAHYRGNMTEVARRVGIGRSTLYRRLKELGLAEPSIAAE
jgi:DNA-binding NtrC family response regulator